MDQFLDSWCSYQFRYCSVNNSGLDEHFEKIGLSAHSLMNHLGRRKRYFISEGENAITMIQNAIDNCMKKNHLHLQDYEMLVVCTDTPDVPDFYHRPTVDLLTCPLVEQFVVR